MTKRTRTARAKRTFKTFAAMRGAFGRLGIAQRIYLSFGVMVVLLAGLSLAGYLGVHIVSGIFGDYRAAAGQSIAISRIVQEIDGLRLTVARYRLEPEPGTAKAFGNKLAQLSLNKPEAMAVFAGDEASAKSVANLQVIVKSYGDAFNSLVELTGEIDTTLAALTAQTSAARDAIGKLNAPGAFKALNEVRDAVGALEAATEDYAASGDKEMLAAVETHNADTTALLTALAKGYPALTIKGNEVVAMLGEHLALVKELQSVQGEYAAVESTKLDGTGFRIQQELASMQGAILASQEKLGAEGDSGADLMNLVIAAGGAGALILAITFAMLMSRWLGKTLKATTEDMRRLAEGNYDIELKGAGQRTEIGRMAEALEVFRTNGIAVRSMDEQRAAAAAAEASRAARREKLQREVERVVAAAVAGDFSRRIDGADIDPELMGFVTSLNRVMETVERGVGETSAVLDALSAADLSRRITGEFEGAFDHLKTSTNSAIENFAEVVHRLQTTSRALKGTTGEILSGANDLSDRTTRQSATIEETSAAMDQLARAVSDSAARAAEVSLKTEQTSRTADEGGQVMGKATEAMERITASSGKISNIIGLIDDIAFQTNLLALNASVEAARAGEAGAGFAVVAVEVRRLAQSAAKASADVKSLVDQSTTDVTAGSKLLEEAAAKLATILSDVRSNTTAMASISEATREQSAAITEINAAIRQMDEMTTQNVALVEETNAAIEQTEAQVGALDQIVATFTLEGAAADEGEDEARAA
jgi:methyl-accepting chemotaxis protein